ncbi:hypothetical protein ABT167_09245 [Streptomyces sp. NPDC001792]|uniref:hypothetical protein n=1 Tax=Streptomyces sp. NPDC001792 TaxID=3154524 RepID=UPI003318911A
MGEPGAERGERIRALLAVPAPSGPEELPSVADADGYGEAIALRRPGAGTPRGAYDAGCMLERRGDFRGARHAFRQAARSGHPRVAAWSLIPPSDLPVRLGDPQGAGSALERAARSANPDVRQAALERIDRLPRGRGHDGTAASTTEPPYGDV